MDDLPQLNLAPNARTKAASTDSGPSVSRPVVAQGEAASRNNFGARRQLERLLRGDQLGAVNVAEGSGAGAELPEGGTAEEPKAASEHPDGRYPAHISRSPARRQRSVPAMSRRS